LLLRQRKSMVLFQPLAQMALARGLRLLALRRSTVTLGILSIRRFLRPWLVRLSDPIRRRPPLDGSSLVLRGGGAILPDGTQSQQSTQYSPYRTCASMTHRSPYFVAPAVHHFTT
jgi:hypothetical protein